MECLTMMMPSMPSVYSNCGQTTVLRMNSTETGLSPVIGGRTKVVVLTSVLILQSAVSSQMFIFNLAGVGSAKLTTTSGDSG